MVRLKKKELVELTEAYQKVLFWFFSFPDKEMSLNDLSQELKISKTTANKVVLNLVDLEFLKLEILGRIWRISCNKYHIYNYSRKISYNLMMVYESGVLDEIHKIAQSVKSITLFGSYRKGDDNENSDIDLAVEINNNEEPKILELMKLKKFGYRENVKANLYIFSRNKIDLNLFANIANGIVLEGFLEVRP